MALSPIRSPSRDFDARTATIYKPAGNSAQRIEVSGDANLGNGANAARFLTQALADAVEMPLPHGRGVVRNNNDGRPRLGPKVLEMDGVGYVSEPPEWLARLLPLPTDPKKTKDGGPPPLH